MKLRTNQKGFSPLILILLLLLLGIVGFAAWKVYDTNNKKDSGDSSSSTKSTSTKKSMPKTTEPTYAKPISEVYRVALADGWVKGTCADNPDLLFLAKSSDKLGKCQSEYFGTVAISKNVGNAGHNEEYYTSDDAYGSVTYVAVTIDGIPGYRVGYTVATENELGTPAVGTKIVQYVLFDGTSTFTIAYSRASGEPDLTPEVQIIADSFDKL